MEDKTPNQEERKFINLSKPISQPYQSYTSPRSDDGEIYPQNNYNRSSNYSNHEFNPKAYQQEIYPNNKSNNQSSYNSPIYKENSVPNSSFDIPTVQPSIVNPPVQATSNYNNNNYNAPSQTQNNTKFCKFCGQKIHMDAVVCTHCGRQVEQLQNNNSANPQPTSNIYINNNPVNNNIPNIPTGNVQYVPVSPCSKRTSLILAALGFIGIGGIHRFYAGKYGSGLLYLMTAGFLGVGTIIDMTRIALGNFRDKGGLPIQK